MRMSDYNKRMFIFCIVGYLKFLPLYVKLYVLRGTLWQGNVIGPIANANTIAGLWLRGKMPFSLI